MSYREALKKLYATGFPPGRPSEYDLAGYGAAKAVGEALQRAGRDLTRDRFIEALESLKEFDPGVIFPVTFTKDRHEGTFSTTIVRVSEKLEWEMAPR